MNRLICATCFLLVLIAFVQTFQAGPPPSTTRETVAELGFDIPPQGVVALEVTTASCRADAPEDGVEPSKCIVTEPGTSKPPSNEDWRRWLEEKPGSVTVTKTAP